MRKIIFAIVVLLLIPTLRARAENYLLEDKDYQFEISIDRDKNDVQVSALKTKKALPPSMHLYLFKNKTEKSIISLKAFDPVKTDEPLKFKGPFNAGKDSLVGLELKWEFDFGKNKTKKSLRKRLDKESFRGSTAPSVLDK